MGGTYSDYPIKNEKRESIPFPVPRAAKAVGKKKQDNGSEEWVWDLTRSPTNNEGTDGVGAAMTTMERRHLVEEGAFHGAGSVGSTGSYRAKNAFSNASNYEHDFVNLARINSISSVLNASRPSSPNHGMKRPHRRSTNSNSNKTGAPTPAANNVAATTPSTEASAAWTSSVRNPAHRCIPSVSKHDRYDPFRRHPSSLMNIFEQTIAMIW